MPESPSQHQSFFWPPLKLLYSDTNVCMKAVSPKTPKLPKFSLGLPARMSLMSTHSSAPLAPCTSGSRTTQPSHDPSLTSHAKISTSTGRKNTTFSCNSSRTPSLVQPPSSPSTTSHLVPFSSPSTHPIAQSAGSYRKNVKTASVGTRVLGLSPGMSTRVAIPNPRSNSTGSSAHSALSIFTLSVSLT
jgi:hypothetical protein